MEQTTTETKQRPGFLTTLCVLSFIGSGIFALIFLLGTFMSGMLMSWFGLGGMESAVANSSAMGGADADTMKAATTLASAGGGMIATFISYFVYIMVGLLLLSVLSIVGVAKMMQLKKSGFWLYLIPNLIMTVLFFMGGSWFIGSVGALFIILYGLNLKHLS